MRVSITVTAGPAQGRAFTFDQPDCFLFGRAADAKVSLPFDKYLSRHHFLLEIAPLGCKVTDLDSTNGVTVNGVRYGGKAAPPAGVKQGPPGVKEVRLKDGDVIRVGRTMLQVAIESDAAADSTHPLAAGGTPAVRSAGVSPAPGSGTATEELAATVLRTAPHPTLSPRGRGKGEGAPAIPGYAIESELGRGGMGVVYKAVQAKSGCTVAIKTLLPHVAVHEEYVRVFEREIDLTRQLKHPNIVELLDQGHIGSGAGQVFYFVLEFVDGVDLGQLLKRKGRPLTLQEAAPIMLGALEGLAHAHAAAVHTRITDGTQREFRGVVHRDLKPQNILLARAPSPCPLPQGERGTEAGWKPALQQRERGTEAGWKPALQQRERGTEAGWKPALQQGERGTEAGWKPALQQGERETWTPKVADFGLSKSFEAAGMTDMTVPGQTGGTPPYWPREQFTYYKYLYPASDVFSIAAVFHQMLTGGYVREGFEAMFRNCQALKRTPFVSDYAKVIMANAPVPLRKRNPSVPSPVAEVIDRALRETEVAADETEMRTVLAGLRYPDAGAFRSALANALKAAGITG